MSASILLLTILFIGANACPTVEPSTFGSTQRPPIDLQDIGYDGTWEQFCDPDQIEKDFPFYPEHELKIMRIIICNMKAANNITRLSLPAFAGYKYCAMIRPQAEDFLEKFLRKFSQEEAYKRTELLSRDIKSLQSPYCFERAEKAFKEKCIHEENAYFRMFRPLLARACAVQWLKTEEILTQIDEVCHGKYLSGQGINWRLLVNSINFRD